ncbi:MAG: hypothetical protein ACTHON_18500, partial [Humibacter sp.]
MSLTPVQVEAKLTALVGEMYDSQKALRTARDAETDAEIKHKRAVAAAFHSPDCPKVTRGGYTVADRDAWIDQQCMNTWAAMKVATTAREVAQDNLRVVLAVAETVRSLGA